MLSVDLKILDACRNWQAFFFGKRDNKKAPVGAFRPLTKSIEGEMFRWGRRRVSDRSAPRDSCPFIHLA